jgi:hypothetical protein
VSLTDLGTAANSSTFGRGINDLGQVVGYSMHLSKDRTRITGYTSLLWENGRQEDLEKRFKDTAGLSDLLPQSISNTGFIVGYGKTDAGLGQAFIAIPPSGQ